jgi:hypothetical protein
MEVSERFRVDDPAVIAFAQRTAHSSAFVAPASTPTPMRALRVRDDFDAMDVDEHETAAHWSEARLIAYAILSAVEAVTVELREMRAREVAEAS